jgi:peptide chain release factor 2
MEIDKELLREAQTLVARLNGELERWELQQLLSAGSDKKGAFLIVEAKPKDIDAHYWAEKLLGMYARWGESKGYRVQVIDEICGEDGVGFESATLEIEGRYACGYLKTEQGRHRLTYSSPFHATTKPQVCSARVEVLPRLDDPAEMEIPEKDLEIAAPSHYGLNLNRIPTAIRSRHIPTGIAVWSRNERSQMRNKEKALILLRSKLFATVQAQGVKNISEIQPYWLKTSVQTAPLIRDYLCAKMGDSLWAEGKVLDCRTGVETAAIASVMSGEIDPFIRAYLFQQAGAALA